MDTSLLKFDSMSSLEIAQITGKNHSHVIRDIKVMFEGLEIDASKFGRTYVDSQNRNQNEYLLPKRECLILASGYSVVLRSKIIDRWIELETKPKPFELPQTFSEALRMLADTKEREEKALLELNTATQKIIADQPKVLFAESVTGSSNSILVRQFAKDLCDGGFEIGQNRLFEWFRQKGYLNSDNEPYQNYVSQGLFEVITRTIGSGVDTFTTKTTKITGKGQVYFTNKIKINH